MKFKIGFSAETYPRKNTKTPDIISSESHAPVKSVVQIHFPSRNMPLSYFNDRFDLHRGDLVFVDGKLAGLRGRVVDVAYNFKIKVSDYKRVIAVADTNVVGELHLAGSHFVSFDPAAMPYDRVIGWFKPPVNDDDEFISGKDDSSFRLDNLGGMGAGNAVCERGHDYYTANKVVYICLDGQYGHAIVEGTEPY